MDQYLPPPCTRAKIFEGDLPAQYRDAARRAGVLAWDIETSGLDWRSDKIALCQLFVPNEPVAVVRMSNTSPQILCSLLQDDAINKVFHHAMFDLRFMSYHWNVDPRNISCTKISAILLDVENQTDHTLKGLLQRYLTVQIDKRERLSDWFSIQLTESQLSYAVQDVLYLPALLTVLLQLLETRGLLQLARECFAHIPTRVKLDLVGYGDIYRYKL